MKSEGEKQKTIAIIVRKNRDVERLLALCEANGIPASAERGADIFAHPIGVLFFSILEFLANPSETEALAGTLAAGLWGLSFAESAELVKQIRAGNTSMLLEKIPVLSKLQTQITAMGGIEYLLFVGEVSGLTNLATQNPLSAEVWRSIIALARDISDRTTVDNPAKLIEALLEYRTSAETKSIKIATGRADAPVHIMTAHGSKGLEYDYVFLPYATEEHWMSKNRGPSFILPREKGDADETRDARRLFYVALTRAKKHATILYGLEEGLGKVLTPLRFLSELPTEHTQVVDVPFLSETPRGKNIAERASAQKTEYIEYAKRVLVEKGLSVTALNHFCECPSLFFYKSILKMPEAPSASSEKGNAMHEALSEVWKSKNRPLASSSSLQDPASPLIVLSNTPRADAFPRLESEATDSVFNEKTIAKIIQDVVQSYFTKSLLPLHEKEVVVEELLKNAPKVAAALLGHFTATGTILTETWMETEFAGEFENAPVTLRLHGKLDAVLDTPEAVRVFDYKTKEGMSENEIRGNTKNSDGNYFRQLTYYKMLLQNNPRYKGKGIEPALVFVKPDDKGRCPIVSLPVESADIEKVEREIRALIQSIWSGDFLSETCEGEDCRWCKMKKIF